MFYKKVNINGCVFLGSHPLRVALPFGPGADSVCKHFGYISRGRSTWSIQIDTLIESYISNTKAKDICFPENVKDEDKD